jgi:CRISPR type III-B/RAMP module RAMP protein Cmr1
MKRLILKLNNNTPWMLKGPDQSKLAPLNGKALRGLMRFWFRALFYGADQVLGGYEIAGNLNKLKTLENFIFGGPDNRSIFDVKVKAFKWKSSPVLWQDLKLDPNKPKGPYIGYHASHSNEPEITNNLNKRYEFQIVLQFNARVNFSDKGDATQALLFLSDKLQSTPEDCYALVVDALQALIIFGGCGSRSRKGYGSLEVSECKSDFEILPNRFMFEDRSALEDEIKRLRNYSNGHSSLCQITAFSTQTELGISQPYRQSWPCFKKFDTTYKLHKKHNNTRHKGHEKLGKLTRSLWDITEPEKSGSSQPDYNCDIDGAISDYLVKYMVGLPLQLPALSGKPSQKSSIVHEGVERRASPLFFSIVKTGQDYCGVLTHLQSKFLPNNVQLGFKFGNDIQHFDHDPELEQKYMTSIINEFCEKGQS